MDGIRFLKLRHHPEWAEQAAGWFHEKWGVPLEAYLDSMETCIRRQAGVPQWLVALDEHGEIVAGAGVIENDFHDRRDLAPNVCALYVREDCRGRGIARALLEEARRLAAAPPSARPHRRIPAFLYAAMGAASVGLAWLSCVLIF